MPIALAERLIIRDFIATGGGGHATAHLPGCAYLATPARDLAAGYPDLDVRDHTYRRCTVEAATTAFRRGWTVQVPVLSVIV
jgi:hypothetical protein